MSKKKGHVNQALMGTLKQAADLARALLPTEKTTSPEPVRLDLTE